MVETAGDRSLAELAADEAKQVYQLRSRRSLRRLRRPSRELARCFDGQRPLTEACQLSGMSLTRGLVLASQMNAAGVLIPVEPAVSFSAQEEAFFASELATGEAFEEEEISLPRNPIAMLFERLRDRLERGLLRPSDSKPCLQ